MERWLVMSNCQTVGLANSLQAQTGEVAVDGLDPSQFKARAWRANARMKRYDRLLLADAVWPEVPKARLERIGAHVRLPVMTFRGYHPDLVYIFNRGKPLSGPVSHYHSAIAFACFRQGIALADVPSYFTGAFFEKCGYFGLWAGERDRLLAEFRGCGLEIGPYFRNWGRGAAFMYSYNHPRIQPLYDMASTILETLGVTPQRSDLIPHDNLASSAIFPVYPEVGEATGVSGQYIFRTTGDYRPIGLSEFLARCYDLYGSIPAEDLAPFPEFRDQVEHISGLL
ncbi:hypothetical protein D2V17_15360 [Aurantiacibacter xanthus]|uniref:Polysaccharide biosynthesis enzyme WcbI domain-containing protein n=1 Tax=Aurantiacibacter xanthus TaxID=1784712 RepID=A0A3A1P1F9_9SPHN|nr:WcbI family polysaccharide biosynthesis putative acetyltransferase [Aurantiacibacter xanthus]RIV82426.1 hypothetical protein D2V17_15360 [Aurantiacibacter xanthus]